LIDLEQPILSAERESIGQFIPDKFFFTPSKGGQPTSKDTNPDLREKVVKAIQAAGVIRDSSAAKWLEALQRGNSLEQLRNKVVDYLKRTQVALAQDGPARQQELKRLYGVMIARREAVLHDQILRALNETGDRLFPVREATIENPHHVRGR